jgi:hypothetical protein
MALEIRSDCGHSALDRQRPAHPGQPCKYRRPQRGSSRRLGLALRWICVRSSTLVTTVQRGKIIYLDLLLSESGRGAAAAKALPSARACAVRPTKRTIPHSLPRAGVTANAALSRDAQITQRIGPCCGACSSRCCARRPALSTAPTTAARRSRPRPAAATRWFSWCLCKPVQTFKMQAQLQAFQHI